MLPKNLLFANFVGMNILYCGDRNTQKGILLSVLSMLEHVDEPLNIYLLTMSYGDGERFRPMSTAFARHLEWVLKRDGEGGFVRLIDCTDMFQGAPPTANLDTRFTPYCMLRLYTDLVPGMPDRLLYLDYDTVCCADPSEFYNQSLDDVEYVAVPDYYGQRFYALMTLRSEKYINSGVLLLNMPRIRESGMLAECRSLCRDEKMLLPDQHALNRAAVSVSIADRKYNDQRRPHDDTVFRHYSTTFRLFPWLHTVSVKPWDTERMHKVLRDYSVDDLLPRLENDMQVIALQEAEDSGE